MAELDAVREETARELGVPGESLDYLAEDVPQMTDDVPEEVFEEAGTEDLEGVILNTFDCRRPAYAGIWLYYYAGCNGVFSRIRRSRVRRIVATGYCGFPVRKYKVFWS